MKRKFQEKDMSSNNILKNVITKAIINAYHEIRDIEERKNAHPIMFSHLPVINSDIGNDLELEPINVIIYYKKSRIVLTCKGYIIEFGNCCYYCDKNDFGPYLYLYEVNEKVSIFEDTKIIERINNGLGYICGNCYKDTRKLVDHIIKEHLE